MFLDIQVVLPSTFLMLSMIFDLVDGWFAARFRPNAPLAPLADRLMDKLVYSIIFPVIAAGMMWRLLVSETDPTQGQLMHAIFVLVLCVTVLVRDSFAQTFTRGDDQSNFPLQVQIHDSAPEK